MTKRVFLPFILIFLPGCLTADSSSAPALQWFKAVSGSGMSSVAAAASDGHGNFYIAGSTTSLDFPTAAAAQPQAGGSPLLRVNPISGALQNIYSPVLATVASIAVDPSNPRRLSMQLPAPDCCAARMAEIHGKRCLDFLLTQISIPWQWIPPTAIFFTRAPALWAPSRVRTAAPLGPRSTTAYHRLPTNP